MTARKPILELQPRLPREIKAGPPTREPDLLSTLTRDVRRAVSEMRGETARDYAKKVFKALWSDRYIDHGVAGLVEGDAERAFDFVMERQKLIAENFLRGVSVKETAEVISREAAALLFRRHRSAADRLSVGERVHVEGDEGIWTVKHISRQGRGIPYVTLVAEDGRQRQMSALDIFPLGYRR
jgi:hypothetical protein